MDIHFNSYKVRYSKMDELMNPLLRSKHFSTVNIYINLDDIFHKLHRPQINTEFQMAGEHAGKQVISNVMNVIGHYRQWAVRKGWDVRVIAYYSSAITGGFKNKIYIPKYRKKFTDINHPMNGEFYFINQGIRDAEKLFRIMSQYVDKIYVIDSRYLEPSIIPIYFSEHVFTPSWNILISRDPYDMQCSYRDTWSFIYPKGDNSQIIDRSNLWRIIARMENVDRDTFDYDTALFPLMISIVGDSYRNIPRIKRVGWKTLFKILNKVEEYASDRSFTSMQILLCQELMSKNTTMDDITNNLNCIDIPAQVMRMNEIDKVDINSQIIDIPDYENLVELNNLYFGKYPINLSMLTDQGNPNGFNIRNPFGV